MEKISYRDKNYRVQNANGWKHIIITDAGVKKRIGVSDINKSKEADPVFEYIFKGGYEKYPCAAMDYWIMRWRMKVKISISDFKVKYINNRKLAPTTHL